MNFSFYILGNPNGYNQYPADATSAEFQAFAQSNTSESQLTVKRNGPLVSYVYVRRFPEQPSSFFGFALVFHGVYCRSSQKLFELFYQAYIDARMRGELIQSGKEKSKYIINKFIDVPLEIERIKSFFENRIKEDFGQDFAPISPAFKFYTGSKTISIQESDEDILVMISEYNIVHVANNEKSISELERTQKMLYELRKEKNTLQKEFNKLLATKKQYSIVIVLCLVLLGCAVGLFIFNKDLQSRDSQIKSLNATVKEQSKNIEKSGNAIARLREDKQKLLSEVGAAGDSIRKLSTKNYELINKVMQLDSIVVRLSVKDSVNLVY